MSKSTLLAVCFLLFTTSCAKDYFQVKGFKKIAKTHQTIAVLPVEMIFSGIPPMNVPPEDLIKQAEAESKAFQISLHSQLMRRQTNGKGLKIELQRTSITNKKIEEAMTIEESWEKTPEELAELLQVDAVLKTRVEKKRYFSDLASYGIDVAAKLLSILTKNPLPFLTGREVKKTNDIYSDYRLLDGKTGNVLWSMTFEAEADYKNPANETIDGLNEKAVKRFPYKK